MRLHFGHVDLLENARVRCQGAHTITAAPDPSTPTAIVVTARDEERLIAATLRALRGSFPAAAVLVADDGSRDRTAAIAREHGAEVLGGARAGKGAAATRAATALLARLPAAGEDAVVLLCDADLGSTAGRLGPLVASVRGGQGELAVAAFARPVGGGFGLALRFARWAARRRTGLRLRAPICGQRALTADALAAVLPFAPGFGMELAMTIDAVRAGQRIVEVPLELEHRATGRTPRGFLHRGRQLADFARVFVSRGRRSRGETTGAPPRPLRA